VAAGFLTVMILIAVVGPLVVAHSPDAVDILNPFAPPSTAHWLGTDDTGRDLFARLVAGVGPTLLGPAIVIVFATGLGAALAISSAWIGGIYDAVVSRALEILFAIPGLVLAILAVAVLGTGFTAPIIALAIAYVPYIARVLRGAALRERNLAYVAALRVQGAGSWAICLRHLLPNLAPFIVVQASVGFGYALLDLAAVSYLGLGIQPPSTDLGLLVASGQPAILLGSPQQSIYASLLVVALILSVNLIGDALSDRFEGAPRLTSTPLVRIDALGMSVVVDGVARQLLDGVSLTIAPGEAVGLVGESGSGKSLTARSLAGLTPQRATVTGRVEFDGRSVLDMDRGELLRHRSRDVAMIFQDPRAHVNPLHSVGDFLTEGLIRTQGCARADAVARAVQLLTDVQVADPERRMRQRPHELSGGLLQRVMIAASLATSPRLLLADEPTTALDVTTQEEVMAILSDTIRSRSMSMLFITHDLDLAAAVCDRLIVMSGGEVVEVLDAGRAHQDARHPCTRELLAARVGFDAHAPGTAAGSTP